MELTEALSIRADLQKRIDQIEQDVFLEEKLAVYSVEEIENIILQANPKRDKKLVKVALRARKSNLNSKFEWTDENKKQLLWLDSKLLDCFDKLKAEAMAIFQSLQNRVDAKDDFLHAFRMEAYVIPYFCYTENKSADGGNTGFL
ncbi:MAG: DIP1984 family protein [Bacteroidales bacterium]|jgi:hypothetical protein|nr:DIP1984 family protein [Bacteroidales bacterium]